MEYYLTRRNLEVKDQLNKIGLDLCTSFLVEKDSFRTGYDFIGD